MQDTTPLQIADRLDAAGARDAGASWSELRAPHAARAAELAATLDDIDALRPARPLLRGEDPCRVRPGALRHRRRPRASRRRRCGDLERPCEHWKRYAAVRDANYVPALYNRVGYVDVTALTDKVAADLELARTWQTGSVKYEGPRAGTERGFRR